MDTHPRIGLGEGDTVIFSSRVIPGNERAIHAMQDALVRRGVRVMTDEDHAVHVSGHPARDELRRLYRLVRPRYAVPTHGEGRHLAAHAALAREMGAEPLLLEDGDILGLAPGRPEIIDAAPTGRLVADGTRLIRLDGALMGERRRMLFNGVVLASMAVDAGGRLRGAPLLSAPGLIEPESPEAERIGEELATALGDLPPAARKDDAAMRDAARAALRRALGRRFDKRPIVDVHLLRV
jgi:ribonuclease J